MSLGVAELLAAMRELQDTFDLDTVAVSRPQSDGHVLTLTVTAGAPLVIERDDGISMAIPEEDA